MRPRLNAILLLAFPLLLSAAPATSSLGIDQKCDERVAQWKDRFDEEHLAAVVAPPFVIAGDGGIRKLERYRDGTILAAQRALQATYFDKKPTEPILIFLFESDGPYRRLAKKWFDDDDVPHFGFYRQRDNVMFMNVATGTGTLVHELVHALMRPDFPDSPDWFNEGLASLYEQCTLDGNTIAGQLNWRLPALKDAIEQKKLRPLRELMDDPHFYRNDLVGLNYAQARYLMLYLQEHGKLRDYYRQARGNHEHNSTGRATFEQIIAPHALDDFDAQWQQWVLSLGS
jgi:hypothetical protein